MRSTCFLILIICACTHLQSCMRMRWSDKKAYKVFSHQHVPLAIYDTIIDQTHIHYAISSNNEMLPTLVFIHGSPGSWFHYKRYMLDPDLRQKFRIVSIDRPGFGYSNFGKAMHLEAQTRRITPVLQRIKTTQPMFLCGHSMGGPLVIKLAAEQPLLFKSVFVVAGAIDVDQEKQERWRHMMGKKGVRWLLPGAFRPSNTELLFLKNDLILLQHDFSKITCNVNFVHGDRDTWVPIENVAYGIKMLKNAASIHSDTIKGADHQIPWKNFPELKSILMRLP